MPTPSIQPTFEESEAISNDAALQNLLLAAHVRGLGGYLKGAPLFCQAAVAEALALPDGWQPAFLVLLGYPSEGAGPPARPDAWVDDFLVSR